MTKYHVWWPSSGDPYYLYNTSENSARANWYGVPSQGVPYLKVDGTLTYVGGGQAGNYTIVRNAINTRRAIASPCTIRVTASTVALPADTIFVTVEVTADVDMHNTDQRLYVELIHRCHTYGSVRWHIFRNMWPNSNGYTFQLDAGQTLTYQVACTTSAGWDINDLRIIAFVQRYNTKEVLQSGFAEVGYMPPLVINEFMANNVSAVQDPAGDYDDWIEIFNTGDTDVSMLGKALTNQCADPDKWVFPNVTLPAGGYLVVWCDNELAEPGLHANFTLAESGDTLVMYDNLASCYLQIDRIKYPSVHQDVSYGRVCDGLPRWVEFETSTPGSANSGCADAVQNLSTLVEGNSLYLFWQPYHWATGYTIYRNSDYPFDPTPGDSIGTTSDTSFVDTDILPVLPSTFYRVKARLD
ncbi:MAG: lamin tail domain-containing protein [bacterium]